MTDVISMLTPEQALMIVVRLCRTEGVLHDAVVAEAMSVLTEIEVDTIAEEVFVALDSIDVQDCWDRSGRSRDGDTSPDEAAAEMVEEELQPYLDQIERYRSLAMPGQELAFCMGALLGIYRYSRESRSEFSEWSVDIPAECAGLLLDQWRERQKGEADVGAMGAFIRARCPEWARWLKDE
jgi:hypothetical protein